jgi:hypothetical protein
MKTLYEVCIKQMNEDNSRFWTIFHVFTLMNGGLLAFSASSSTNWEIKLCIAIVAGVICVFWWRIQERMGFWSRKWEDKADSIEKLYVADVNEERQRQYLRPLPGSAKVMAGRKPKEREDGVKRWPGMSTRKAGRYLPRLFFLAWVVILLILLAQCLD